MKDSLLLVDAGVMVAVLAGIEFDVVVLAVSAKNNMYVSILGFFRCGLFPLHSVTDKRNLVVQISVAENCFSVSTDRRLDLTVVSKGRDMDKTATGPTN